MRAFSLPLGDRAAQRAGLREAFGPSAKPEPAAPASDERTAQRQAIAELLGWRRAEPVAPVAAAQAQAESEGATLTRFHEVVTALDLKLGRDVLSAADRAALEADPVARASWLRKIDDVAALAKVKAEASAEAAKADADASADRERGRLSSTGLLAALEAHRGAAEK